MTLRMKLNETAPAAYRGFMESSKAIKESPLSVTVQELVKIRASQINACAFCVGMHIADARRLGEPEERIHHLTVWPESPLYTEAERAALAYTEAVTRGEPVTDELWDTLGKHYPDEELGNLVALVALVNALNRVGVPLKAGPPAVTV